MPIQASADTAVIRNPVLPGFHPDPSILRVGDDYYVATSTFEWYPGVRLHHSRDLAHWRPLGGVLDARRLLDLAGTRDSGGVWAPDLSYADGLFYVVFTNVDSYAGGFWDTPNYLVTAPSIDGPWSDPVPLHAIGFDPSLFHDDDGRSWLTSMVADYRPGNSAFGGITIQEYDRGARRLVGEARTIFTGTAAGVTEGPHIYRHDGWYYLFTAEGGTGWEHQETVARSRTLFGPYEVDPAGPLLSAYPHPALRLQKAGHGSLVATQSGEWYLAHLVGRPLTERGRCVLGRETAIQRVEWSADGWPRIAGQVPHDEMPGPALPAHPWPAAAARDDFASAALDPRWSTLRRPADPEWVTVGGGRLRLVGGRSPATRQAPSLVATRITDTRATFEAELVADPTGYHHLAGITAYYNSRNWYYLRLSHDEQYGRHLDVLVCDRGRLSSAGLVTPVPSGAVTLLAELDGAELRFGYALAGADAEWFPTVFDASTLSDEYATEFRDGVAQSWGFTGAFFGLWAQDLTGGGWTVDFTHAEHR